MSALGHNRERQVRRVLEKADWWVCRAAGSLGDADLVALKAGRRPLMVEVKATAAGPYAGFGPKDRTDLLFAAELAGADATLAWWPSRGKLRWLPSVEWPAARTFPSVTHSAAPTGSDGLEREEAA